jgi:hypothetical protein
MPIEWCSRRSDLLRKAMPDCDEDAIFYHVVSGVNVQKGRMLLG